MLVIWGTTKNTAPSPPVSGFTVLSSAGVSYSTGLVVLNSSGNPYTVTTTVLSSNGTSYVVV